jgi:hypothetical protein
MAHHYEIEHEVLGTMLHGRKARQSPPQSRIFRTCTVEGIQGIEISVTHQDVQFAFRTEVHYCRINTVIDCVQYVHKADLLSL